MSNLIPEKWKYASLQEIAKNYRGSIVDGPFGSNLKTSDYVKSGVPVLQGKNITNNVFVWSDVRFISKHKADELSRSSIRVGDILMVKIGSIGYSAIVDNLKNYKYAIIPANLLKISVDDKKASTKYIHQYLISPQGKKRILNIASATAQPALSLSAIKRFKIPIPPIIEQKKIASILTSVDDVIEKIQAQINKLQDLKKATMNELLTKGIGHTEFKESSIGKIPKSWELISLLQVANKKDPFSFAGGPFGSNLKTEHYCKSGIRIIQLQNIGDGKFLDNYKIFTSKEKANELRSCNIFPDDIIISKMGDPVARACIMPSIETRYLMASDGIRLSVNKNEFDIYFILETINHHRFRRKAERISIGSTRKRISLTELRTLIIACPSLKEQKNISSIILSIEDKINQVKDKLFKFELLKKSLMQDLLTGKVRVSVN